MAETPLRSKDLANPEVIITGVPGHIRKGQSFTCKVEISGKPTDQARIVWEASGTSPGVGKTYRVMVGNRKKGWIEVQVYWPDGEHAAKVVSFEIAP